MLKKNKQTIIGTFYDKKDGTYYLMKEKRKRLFDKMDNCWEEIYFGRKNEIIEPWDFCNLDLDLTKSSIAENQLLITDYLGTGHINRALWQFNFPFENLLLIWNKESDSNSFIRETLLSSQPIAEEKEFLESLKIEEQWLFLTQNQYRTTNNMKPYKEMFEKIVLHFLVTYLSEDMITKHEQIYGGWRRLINHTFLVYFPDLNRDIVIQKAVEKAKDEQTDFQNSIEIVKEKIKILDLKYQNAMLSEKYKIEEEMKEIIEEEKGLLREIEKAEEKQHRIENFFNEEIKWEDDSE